MNEISWLDLARSQIEFARQYTLSLLEDLEDEAWFHQPPSTPTSIAWQVGHLAMAQYGLCLFRQRGRQPIDRQLMPSKFRKQFSRGSTPLADASQYPPAAELRDALHKIHQQTLRELPEFSQQQLAEPVEQPYAVFANKLGSLLFCAQHEMLHAGQVGLLRRLLGKPPIR